MIVMNNNLKLNMKQFIFDTYILKNIPDTKLKNLK